MKGAPCAGTWTDVALAVATLSVAFVLKQDYATATAGDLAWILGPTAKITSVVCGSPFARTHDGYANADLHAIIVPACAGVNYLIVVFCMLAFGFTRGFARPARKCLFVATCAVIAYVSTLSVNAARIALGVFSHRHALAESVLSAERAHRIEGVLVYLTSLWLIHWVAETLFRQSHPAHEGLR